MTTAMNRNYVFIAVLFVSIGVMVGALSSPSIVVEKTITLDNNPAMESRLQSEIESNQAMTLMVSDVINACNEKLLDKYNNTEKKLKRQNDILQQALSKIRDT